VEGFKINFMIAENDDEASPLAETKELELVCDSECS